MTSLLRISKYVYQIVGLLSALLEKLDQLSKRNEELIRMLQGQQPDEIMYVQEVADFFHVTVRTVRAWKDSGKLKDHPKGSNRFLKSEVMKLK